MKLKDVFDHPYSVQRKNPASLDSFLSASEFLLYSFEKARYLPEFAREVANAGAVRKFGEGLLNYAGTESCDIEVGQSILQRLLPCTSI